MEEEFYIRFLCNLVARFPSAFADSPGTARPLEARDVLEYLSMQHSFGRYLMR